LLIYISSILSSIDNEIFDAVSNTVNAVSNYYKSSEEKVIDKNINTNHQVETKAIDNLACQLNKVTNETSKSWQLIVISTKNNVSENIKKLVLDRLPNFCCDKEVWKIDFDDGEIESNQMVDQSDSKNEIDIFDVEEEYLKILNISPNKFIIEKYIRKLLLTRNVNKNEMIRLHLSNDMQCEDSYTISI
ncbi:MAG: hypothetical protein MHPSP_001128, partial [Paramarteilia canceri]